MTWKLMAAGLPSPDIERLCTEGSNGLLVVVAAVLVVVELAGSLAPGTAAGVLFRLAIAGLLGCCSCRVVGSVLAVDGVLVWIPLARQPWWSWECFFSAKISPRDLPYPATVLTRPPPSPPQSSNHTHSG